MNYTTAENNLAAYLESRLSSDVQVNAFPESQKQFEKAFPNNRVVVAFNGEKSEPNQSSGYVSQHTVVSFAVLIQSRVLRGETGLYALSEVIKGLLIGYKLPDADMLYYVSHQAVDYSDNIWEHQVIFECRSMRVYGLDIDEGPLLKKVDFDEKISE